MTSVMSCPSAALPFTEFRRLWNGGSTLMLTWQSPSCSMWLATTRPVAVRHGLDGASTVSAPGTCTPCFGLAGHRPADGGGGQADVVPLRVAGADALPAASNASTPSVYRVPQASPVKRKLSDVVPCASGAPLSRTL